MIILIRSTADDSPGKKQFIEKGFEAVLEHRLSAGVNEGKADRHMEGKLVALCRSEPLMDFLNGPLHLLADKMVELNYVERIHT